MVLLCPLQLSTNCHNFHRNLTVYGTDPLHPYATFARAGGDRADLRALALCQCLPAGAAPCMPLRKRQNLTLSLRSFGNSYTPNRLPRPRTSTSYLDQYQYQYSYPMLITKCCLGILQACRAGRHIPRRLVHVDSFQERHVSKEKMDMVFLGRSPHRRV
ncbi:hypothetical protein D6D02_05917 [Aureobasidium pullulans]|uniref:Uncharacterized protein n=1 Tax=Aureobasidium pullulans TaxID=5580 RepID=A0A4S9Z428_AURPU|nr:hypothetical protein D6D26_03568 [Aureobasidium pullulans]THW18590.1 hypothetical protein D6D24_03296 [Aureobasidium pullulans]THW59302.1 hypothetical protein D6D20_06616 [Aureobasidium pullulans]THX97915.1 hypothetical protein D6D03_08103 [Aureobasidium pullulans]THY11185.1 hypothetical protein D6D02_05917 [Aureobasidium pullulans]